MKLATSSDVVTRMGSSVLAGNISIAADSVLEAATPILENIIGTPFSSSDRIDWFSYNVSSFDTSEEFVLNLQQAYVDGGIAVYFSNDGAPVLQDFSNADPVSDASLFVDTDRGIVTLLSLPMSGTSTVAVKYSAGFSEGSSDIPSWLKEAAVSAAVRLIHAQTLSHSKDDISQAAPELHRLLQLGTSNYIRPRMNGVFPVRSTVL